MAALSTIATVATIASAGASIIGARKQQKAQEKATTIANRQAASRRQRNIRQRLAAARVQRAEIQAAGFAAGSPGSSIVQGAIGGARSDVASAAAFEQGQFTFEQQRVATLNQGNRDAALFGGISGIAGIFSDQQNLQGIQNLFS